MCIGKIRRPKNKKKEKYDYWKEKFYRMEIVGKKSDPMLVIHEYLDSVSDM